MIIAIVTESSEHDRVCALSCVTKVVQTIEDLNKNIKIWSDGCAAQFRSKFVFYLVAETLLPTKNILWNYNERHHGKGPMDGLVELQ